MKLRYVLKKVDEGYGSDGRTEVHIAGFPTAAFRGPQQTELANEFVTREAQKIVATDWSYECGPSGWDVHYQGDWVASFARGAEAQDYVESKKRSDSRSDSSE